MLDEYILRLKLLLSRLCSKGIQWLVAINIWFWATEKIKEVIAVHPAGYSSTLVLIGKKERKGTLFKCLVVLALDH